jgi:hypothetical protein
VLGNDEAFGLDAAVIAAADSICDWLFRSASCSRGDDSMVQATLS